MNRIDYRIIIGAALVLLGGFMFAERLGLLRGAADMFGGVMFLIAAVYFLYLFARDRVARWWAVIPGLALAGLAAESLLGRLLAHWGGFFFLGALGLSFLVIYFANRERWWAIIPGGVLLTLAAITVLEQTLQLADSGGVLFVGFGVTFLLVAVLASRTWAYIPGIALLVFGAVLGMSATSVLDYLWPVVMVVGGLLLIWRFSRAR